MQRRIDQADGHREAVHGLEDADEIAALKRQQLVERRHTRFLGVRQDHLLDRALALVAAFRLLEIGEEHVLRAAQADAFGAELARFASVLRRVRVGAHAEAPHLIDPLHQRVVGFRELRRHQWHLAGIHYAFAAIEREPVPFLHHLAVSAHRAGFVIDVQRLRAYYAALAPTARHHSRVTGLAARCGENTLRDGHAPYVFRTRFAAYQNHFLALGRPILRLVRGENHF